MFQNKIFFVVLLLVLVMLPRFQCKSVIKKGLHDKGKKPQATIDKEVLFEDTDYDEDDDVMDLPVDEQKKRLKHLVEKKIDANHDGSIDREELVAWCLKAYNSFEIEDITEDFPIIDKNHDSGISWSEHVQDNYGADFKDGDAFTEQNGESAPGLEKKYNLEKIIFAVADSNEDKILQLEEYLVFKHPRKNEHAAEEIVKYQLELMDSDGDGSISLVEYLETVEEHDKEMEKERFEDDFDANEDGMLTEGEIVSIVDPGNHEESEEEADHLIEECDTDGDFRLSVDEITENHQLWVDSDATDYGRHLMMAHDEF